jgi:hypothetical protein
LVGENLHLLPSAYQLPSSKNASNNLSAPAPLKQKAHPGFGIGFPRVSHLKGFLRACAVSFIYHECILKSKKGKTKTGPTIKVRSPRGKGPLTDLRNEGGELSEDHFFLSTAQKICCKSFAF